MASSSKAERKRKRKYQRARVRHFLFTVGPNRVSGGRLLKRHLSQDVVLREIEIVSAHWPAAFDGFRIAHISDLHVGELLPVDRAIEIAQDLNDLEADLIACTGDIVDLHNEGIEPLLRTLGEVQSRCGTVTVFGNHDELDNLVELERMCEAANITTLRNDCLDINHSGAHLRIAGVDWDKTIDGNTQNVRATCGDDNTHLLLAHNPKAFRQAARMDIPLTLAGHTHGGQIARRAKPKSNLALTYRHSAGLYEKDESNLFVTTGVGAWFPVRVNCPAEVAVLTMRHTPDGKPKRKRRRDRKRKRNNA